MYIKKGTYLVLVLTIFQEGAYLTVNLP